MDDTDGLVLLVVITGVPALVLGTGWQVVWMLVVAGFALVRRAGWQRFAVPPATGTS
ncbi:hypothetical protein [Actinomycetospora sp. NBRC 106378]|jgi:hypothetical protein|uniref:hypothetical protein n=1 Tax=Actinomycetospora sp. NBRC 106378 TaxID=3032208 RepID=UPI0024A525D3|nr:hypothetical protein [Actinomycetospora sp. NBRC 106378]GLZ53306.1 hypothetical protein Acsp07_29230 [Actinomycetospora sp. NBRC 106378]